MTSSERRRSCTGRRRRSVTAGRRLRRTAPPLEATRYHSLVVDRASIPDELEITAETDDGVVMGLRHRTHDVEGVQFHPESVLTTAGHDLLANWLDRAG